LLQELNHRVKNSIQTIVSFLRLQIDETDDVAMVASLTQVENRILSISHLYALLHNSHNISTVHANDYLSLLIEQIQSTFAHEHIAISLHTDLTLDSETAVYCGFIVNEALTNAMQHAFAPDQPGEVCIILEKESRAYRLIIHDNGRGFDAEKEYDSLGLVIMESLSTYQLRGSMQINTQKGTHIKIIWERQDG
jgi:two-component sensor histidine kinase